MTTDNVLHSTRTGRAIVSATSLSAHQVALLKWAALQMMDSQASGVWCHCRRYSNAWLARVFHVDSRHIARIVSPTAKEDVRRWHDIQPASPPATHLWWLSI